TIFALGIMPYITASIILQLLTVVWPYLEKLSKEGELGRRKITTYTRYLTVVLSAVQSAGIAIALQRQGGFVVNPGIGFILMSMAEVENTLSTQKETTAAAYSLAKPRIFRYTSMPAALSRRFLRRRS